jgi:hypothetical protein
MYDLGLFNIDTFTDTNVDINSSHQSIRSQYYSPYKFAELKNSETKHIILNKSFSMLHNNVRSLKRNLENLQTHLLQELHFNFRVIGITETKIRDNDFFYFNPNMENVPTPLASGGVGMYIRDNLKYTVSEKCSNKAFQALWVEIDFPHKSIIICGVIY